MCQTDDKATDSFHAADHGLQNPFVPFLPQLLLSKRVFLYQEVLRHDAEFQLDWSLLETADAEAICLALLMPFLVAPCVIQKADSAYSGNLENPVLLLFRVIAPYVYAVCCELERFYKPVAYFMGVG